MNLIIKLHPDGTETILGRIPTGGDVRLDAYGPEGTIVLRPASDAEVRRVEARIRRDGEVVRRLVRGGAAQRGRSGT